MTEKIDYLTLYELSELYGVPYVTLHGWCRQGKIIDGDGRIQKMPHLRHGRQIWVIPEQAEAYIKKARKPQPRKA